MNAGIAAPGRLLPLLIGAVALAVFGVHVYTHAINVPFHDDTLDILDFVLRLRDAAGLEQRLHILFEQYNDHRTASSRLVYWLASVLQGEVNFRTLSLLVNLCIPVLLLQYAFALRGEPGRPWMLAFGALAIANPRAYDFVSWPNSAFAFYGVLAYSFAALLCLQRPGRTRVLLAALCALAAMYSLSSGRLTWVAGAVSLLLALRRGEPNAARYLLAWCALAIVALALFHAGFDNRNPPGDLLRTAFERPLFELQFFLVVLGSGASFGVAPLATAIGAGTLAVLTWVSVRDGVQRIGALHLLAWLLVLSCAAITVGRAPYSGVENALTPRYSLGSLNLLVCVVLLLARRLAPRPAVAAAIVALGAVLCIGNYRVFVPQLEAQLASRATAFNGATFWVYGYKVPFTNAIVQRAVDAGLYRPPQRPIRLSLPADD